MADKSFVLRLELENGQVVVKGLEDIGAKGDAAMKKVGDAARNEASAGMRAMTTAATEAQIAANQYAASLGPLGAVLKSIGPTGLIAAAAIGAVTIAAKAAGGFALDAAGRFDDLADTAGRLGTTAGELIKWRNALEDTAGSMADFNATAEAFQAKVGAWLAGVGKNKAIEQAFAAIGLTKEDLRNAKTLQDRLFLIADAISTVGDRAARAGIADKLGLLPMLPLLERGRKGIEDLQKPYQSVADTADEGVERTGALADKVNHLQEAMQIRADNLFVRIAPAVINFLTWMDKILEKANSPEWRWLFGGSAFTIDPPTAADWGVLNDPEYNRLSKEIADLEEQHRQTGGLNPVIAQRIFELMAQKEALAESYLGGASGTFNVYGGGSSGEAPPPVSEFGLGGNGDVAKLSATERAALKAAEALRKLVEARREWRNDPLAAGARRKDMEAASDAVTAQVDAEIAKLDQSFQAARAVAESFRGDFTSAIKTALLSGDVLGAGEQLAYALADRFASALADQIYDALIPSLFENGGGGGGLGGFLSGLFNSGGGGGSLQTSFGTPYAWAEGGDFKRGQWGWVGERGPELVRWGASGTVIPADQSRAMMRGGTQVQLTVINKGAPAKVDVEQRPDGRGGTNIVATLTPIVRDIMKSETRRGSLDGAMRDRFGARPKTESGQ